MAGDPGYGGGDTLFPTLCGGPPDLRRRCMALCAALLLCAAPLPVLAHAVLLGDSLANKSLPSGRANRVRLRFNATIEVALSSVTLLRTRGPATNLRISAGTQPGTLIVEIPALAPGRYALRYRVLASDGHMSDETLRLRVVAAP